MNSTSTSGSTAISARSRPRLYAFAGLTVLFLVAAAWRPDGGGLPLCGIKLAVGISCPGCGMTRSLAALAREEPSVAMRYHAFGPIIAAGAVLAWAALGIGLVTGRNLLPDFGARRTQVVMLGFVAAFLMYWLVRLWQGMLP